MINMRIILGIVATLVGLITVVVALLTLSLLVIGTAGLAGVFSVYLGLKMLGAVR